MSTRARPTEPEVFIEYGISYQGKPARRFTWTPEYDAAMRDCAHRISVHGDEMGPIEVVERTTTITVTDWRPATRPDTDPDERRRPTTPTTSPEQDESTEAQA